MSGRASGLKSWWARRFVLALRDAGFGGRLVPGRARARRGHVLSLEISPRGVEADVKGPGDVPCRARVSLPPIGAAVLRRAARSLGGRARFVAGLLAGTIDEEAERAFSRAGGPLLPANAGEIRTSCTCRDPFERCLHVAAVLSVLAERMDTDPFVLLRLRGLEREKLLRSLQGRRHGARSGRPSLEAPPPPVLEPGEPLPAAALGRPEAFFRPRLSAGSLKTTFMPPDHPEAVLTRLGPPPLGQEAAGLLVELHRAVGLGAAERLSEWEWRRAGTRRRQEGDRT